MVFHDFPFNYPITGVVDSLINLYLFKRFCRNSWDVRMCSRGRSAPASVSVRGLTKIFHSQLFLVHRPVMAHYQFGRGSAWTSISHIDEQCRREERKRDTFFAHFCCGLLFVLSFLSQQILKTRKKCLERCLAKRNFDVWVSDLNVIVFWIVLPSRKYSIFRMLKKF